MKSNDEGMNTTVFALCTADFMTEGSNYAGIMKVSSSRREKKGGPYVLGEVVESFIKFISRIRAIEANEILATPMNEVTLHFANPLTDSTPSGTWSEGQKCSVRIFPATFLSDLLNRALVSGVS